MILPDNKWKTVLEEQCKLPYYISLQQFIIAEYGQEEIYPPKNQIYSALSLTDYDNVKVVILGQDPYHGVGQAQGLAFSVPDNFPLPPSLRNIYKELAQDLNVDTTCYHGNLEGWAKQGVLLLNSVLTVQKGKAFSHKQKGWEQFTDAIIMSLNAQKTPIIFILWGKPAQQKKAIIATHHIIIEAVHPSPLSAYRGFFGSAPFSKVNRYLIEQRREPIDWLKLNPIEQA